MKNSFAPSLPSSRPLGMLNRIVCIATGTTVMLGMGNFCWDNLTERGEKQKNMLNSLESMRKGGEEEKRNLL